MLAWLNENRELILLFANLIALIALIWRLNVSMRNRFFDVSIRVFESFDKQWSRFYELHSAHSLKEHLTEAERAEGRFVFLQSLSSVELLALWVNSGSLGDRATDFYRDLLIGVLNNYSEDREFSEFVKTLRDQESTFSEIRKFVSANLPILKHGENLIEAFGS